MTEKTRGRFYHCKPLTAQLQAQVVHTWFSLQIHHNSDIRTRKLKGCTVETLVTHTLPWTVQPMGFQRLWVGGDKNFIECHEKTVKNAGFYDHFWVQKPMGFAHEGLWVMDYHGLMGYGMQIPAHQLGGSKMAWDFRGYGLSDAWVTRVSTTLDLIITATLSTIINFRSSDLFFCFFTFKTCDSGNKR
ncbi:uncharacterized protein LACBIDRAFT_333497 [Laccaria bicolor S238N-H82]|uniref:Predicted protein n=1 Tax=Laccaria bicolor (strain S238N-H82 / ATCC MYA-4686) TaxID=486041 RepID=B0DW38_LACBS|nr:uncharacterized protein LACBIDRAFT_333497 [Laccaria bicolor S238N-H82]EDR01168.1 predicted protein [Laccaria bicolor S238N-H82]|eukprot:XP_001888210.1 predicted protein [Laccaria bicolor S238N-H82]